MGTIGLLPHMIKQFSLKAVLPNAFEPLSTASTETDGLYCVQRAFQAANSNNAEASVASYIFNTDSM